MCISFIPDIHIPSSLLSSLPLLYPPRFFRSD
jgi:hypothetical protein